MFRLKTVATVTGALAVASVAYAKYRIDTYVDPYAAKVKDAGYAQKQAQIGEVDLSYAEGPDNGPPLVLLHAQLMDWFDYSRVLPELAQKFHVFVIDYPGHGTTTCPRDYPMTADRIGADLGDFIQTVVGAPAFVTGNSSGGLLTVWLAANRPELVRAIVLEDPPLFSAEYPRIKQTIAYRSFATSRQAADEGFRGDFLLYWIEHSRQFFATYVFPGAGRILTLAVREFQRARPGEPVEIGLLPSDLVRMFIRGLGQYDPRFGTAFYDGTWNEGFDHAATLRAIACPTLLLHANFTIMDDGTLNGAMTQDDADRAASLIPDGRYQRVDAAHVIHLDQPRRFIDLVEGFFR